MANEFIIKNGFQSRGDSEVTGSLNLSENISGSATSTASFGTYLGDGSQLTGISSTPFPFTGSANISGSLQIRGGSALTGANIFEIKNTSADAYDDLFAFDDNGKITHEVDGTGDKHVIQTTSGATMFKFGVDSPSAGYLKLQSNGFDRVTLNQYGVGIGYGSSPTSNKALQVIGNTQITGSLTISGSLHAFTLDSDSVILGQDAGKHAAATAENNVIIGVSAGISASNDNNVLIGKQAGEQVTGDGSDNIFIGLQAGQKGADKQENVAIGRNAHTGYATSDTSDGNVSIGYFAGRLFQNSNLNIAIGYYAGHGNGSGGSSALRNVFLGAYAGYNHWNGIQDNIYVGYYAGAFNQQGDRNIIIGSGSTANGNPSDQLRIGHADIHAISGSLTTGDVIFYNTASAPNFSGSFQGDGSALTNLPSTSPFPFTGDASITGSLTVSGSFNAFRLNTQNVVLGQDAGFSTNVNGPRNVFVGYQAAYTNTIGDDNVCIGRAAGYALSTNASDGNIFIGSLAGAGGTSPAARMSDANNNIGIGYEALLYLTSGDQNIGMGVRTLRNISTGKYNYAYGDGALYNTNSGQDNIGIGYQAGYNQTTGNGNITIGSGSLGIAEESNQLRIGHGDNHIISGSLETGHILLQTTTISGSLLNTGTVSLNNGTYTLTGTQQFILIDPSGGDVTINMPDAATYPGREIRFKLTQAAGANTVTLQRQGADTIDGATTYTDLDIQYESISTVSNGSNGWFIF